jgi:ABC-type glycerol-3-phosphate transport system substrate-binding protein
MKRIVSLLLVLILTAGGMTALAGCSDNGAEKSPSETTPSADSPDISEEAETEWIDPFAGTDFGGRAFRVYSSVDESDATNADKFMHGSDELNGESVNDAVYNRNQKVSELLNIKFEFTDAEWTYSNADAQLKLLIQAGSDEWDVMANDIRTLANLSRDGFIHNVYNSSILDLTQTYWYGDAMRDCQFIEGGMYLLIGDYFTDALQSCHCLYCNEQIINNVYGSTEYVNDMVFAGHWTFDNMIQVMEDTMQDLNGDGQMKQGEDLFGFTCWGKWGSMIPFLIGTGIQFIERTEDGPQFCFNNERSVKILEKLNELFYADGALTTLADYSDAGLRIVFGAGQSLIIGYNRLGDLAKMRDIEFTIGILPYPKLDGDQENYVSSLHDTSEVGAIPMTLPPDSMDFCTTCLEVFCRETGKMVIPKYYEEGLKVKYSNGQDDARLIDLIHDSISSPFPVAFNGTLGGFLLGTCFSTPLGSNSTDFASAYQKSSKAALKTLDKTAKAFLTNLENGN